MKEPKTAAFVNATIRMLFLLFFAGSIGAGFAQQGKTDSLLSLLASAPADTNRVSHLIQLGQAYLRVDSLVSMHYYKEALTLAKRLNYTYGISETYAKIATLHFIRSDLDSAQQYVDSSLHYLHKSQQPRKLASAYASRASIHLTLNNYQAALIDCLTAEHYARTYQDEEVLAQVFLLQANIYRSQNQLSEAMEFQGKALLIFQRNGERAKEGQVLYTSAMLLLRMRDTNGAKTAIQKAIAIADSLQNYANMATYRQVLVEVLLDQKHYIEAEKTAHLALAFAKKSDSPQVRGYVLEVFALLHEAQNNHTEVIAYALPAYRIFETGKDPWHHRKLALILANVYENVGNPSTALHYYKIYNSLNEQILHQELDTETKHLQLQFRYREKDNEVKLLAQEKELHHQRAVRLTMLSVLIGILALVLMGGLLLLRSRSRLKQQVHELQLRNNIASDLHDEVGSSLSSIHLLSQMIKNQPADDRRKDLLDTLIRNVKETVDRVTDIVWVVKPEENEHGSLRERIERFAYDICTSAGIELDLQISEIPREKLTMDQRKNIYLIFKEAITNAVKYSHAPRIEVHLRLNGRTLELRVNDFGTGFDPKNVLRSNGLNNMEKRAKELGGTFSIFSRPGLTSVQLDSNIG